MAKAKVFVDSSIIISALLSAKGGSFYILNDLKDSFVLQFNEYGLEEIQEIIHIKFSNMSHFLSRMHLLLGFARVIILPYPEKKESNPLKQFVAANDAPILASALKYSDYLLTLDNGFFKPKVITLSAKAGLTIFKPKDLIENFRNTQI